MAPAISASELPQRPGAVEMHRLEEALHAGAAPRDLLGVDEDPARTERREDARVEPALARVVEVMDGQRRNDGVERSTRQIRAQRLDTHLPASGKPGGRLLQHLGRRIEQMELRGRNPVSDRRGKQAGARAEVKDARRLQAKARHQFAHGAVELIEARDEPAAFRVVGGGVPNGAHRIADGN